MKLVFYWYERLPRQARFGGEVTRSVNLLAVVAAEIEAPIPLANAS